MLGPLLMLSLSLLYRVLSSIDWLHVDFNCENVDMIADCIS
jgi:hypothetical protein